MIPNIQSNICTKRKRGASDIDDGVQISKNRSKMKHLELPEAFENLLTLYSSVEFVVASMVRFNSIPTFAKVKLSVECATKKPLSEKHLKQMEGILPGCFTFTIDKVRGRERGEQSVCEFQIRRNEQRSSSLSSRIAEFRSRVEQVVQAASATLDQMDVENYAGDRAITPPEAELPFVLSFEKSGCLVHRNEILRSTYPLMVDNSLEDKAVPQELSKLPHWLIQKVRRREVQKNSNIVQSKHAARRRELMALPRLCDHIESYSRLRRKASFYVHDLALNVNSQFPLEEQLEVIASMIPAWCSLIDGVGGRVLQINRKYNFSLARRQLVADVMQKCAIIEHKQ